VKRLALVPALVLLAGCTGHSPTPVPSLTASTSFRVSSPDFANGGTIPARFTCDGADVAPTIRWAGNDADDPLVLEMTDPDARGFVHWLVYQFTGQSGLVGGPSTLEGRNDFGTTGYGGPCPPKGDPPHRYVFTLFVVPRLMSPIAPGEDSGTVLGRTAVAVATLTATYDRA